jgi:hypothetical protein
MKQEMKSMANEPTREECINNLREHMNEHHTKPDFTRLVNGDFAIGTDKAKLLLKWKGHEFLFQKQGDLQEADMILQDWCAFLHKKKPGVEMVDLEEIPKAMLHPGKIDEEGYAECTVKGWVSNQPYIMLVRITQSIKRDKI